MSESMSSTAIRHDTVPRRLLMERIVGAFPSVILRAYCRIRFLIIGPRFLDTIEQYLPKSGEVLDIGSGFGTSGLYFGSLQRTRNIHGYDLAPGRVETANAAAASLGLTNVRFAQGDAATLALTGQFDAAYAIDVIHHLPREAVAGFLAGIHQRLKTGGRFLIKEVDSSPAYKRWFSLLTDRVMGGFSEVVYYWPMMELRTALTRAGFTVFAHPMPDILPYPHVLYVCEKREDGGS